MFNSYSVVSTFVDCCILRSLQCENNQNRLIPKFMTFLVFIACIYSNQKLETYKFKNAQFFCKPKF